MKIYGDVRSGNCDKVRFTVDYLRLPYEWVEINSVAGATRTPEFLAKTRRGKSLLFSWLTGAFSLSRTRLFGIIQMGRLCCRATTGAEPRSMNGCSGNPAITNSSSPGAYRT